MLGIEARKEVWEIDRRSTLKFNQPDAVWHEDGERVAIEADTGQYSMRVVAQKLDSFAQQGYTTTAWGTGTKRRGKNIIKALKDKYTFECLNPTWWGI